MVNLVVPPSNDVYVALDLDGWWDIFLPEVDLGEAIHLRWRSTETLKDALSLARIACGSHADLASSRIVVAQGSAPEHVIDDPNDDVAFVEAILKFS